MEKNCKCDVYIVNIYGLFVFAPAYSTVLNSNLLFINFVVASDCTLGFIFPIPPGIKKDKTMTKKLMYINNNDKQNTKKYVILEVFCILYNFTKITFYFNNYKKILLRIVIIG